MNAPRDVLRAKVAAALDIPVEYLVAEPGQSRAALQAWAAPASDAQIVFLGDPRFERAVWTAPIGPTCPFHPDRRQVRNGMCGPCAEKADDAR